MQKVASAHQHQAGDENRFAADLVAEVPADDAAEGADQEADTEGGEGQQGPGERVTGGEEVGAEVQGRGGAVADEVVGLDGGPDSGTDGHLPGTGGAVGVALQRVRVRLRGTHRRGSILGPWWTGSALTEGPSGPYRSAVDCQQR